MLQAFYRVSGLWGLTLSVKIARKPYIMGSLRPKALNYESSEGKVRI